MAAAILGKMGGANRAFSVKGILRMIPLRLHMSQDGTLKDFLRGKAYVVPQPVLPGSDKGPRLEWLRIELVDSILIVYCIWSMLEIQSALPQNMVLSLWFYTMSMLQVMLAMSVLVMLNRDGTKWRVVVYIAAAYFMMSRDLLDVNQLSSANITNMCLLGIIMEILVVPAVHAFQGRRSTTPAPEPEQPPTEETVPAVTVATSAIPTVEPAPQPADIPPNSDPLVEEPPATDDDSGDDEWDTDEDDADAKD